MIVVVIVIRKLNGNAKKKSENIKNVYNSDTWKHLHNRQSWGSRKTTSKGTGSKIIRISPSYLLNAKGQQFSPFLRKERTLERFKIYTWINHQ